MDPTIDSGKNIVLSHLLEYNNKTSSMDRVSVVSSITTQIKAVVEHKHKNKIR